jgi:hypothetical protein
MMVWLPSSTRIWGGDKSRSIEMLMREARRNVRIAPKLYVTDRINAGRTIFPQCQFDAEKYAGGLQALRRYQWGPRNPNGITGREPLHNDASHGSDAYQCLAGCAKAAAGTRSRGAAGRSTKICQHPMGLGQLGVDEMSIDELIRLAKQGVALQGGDLIAAQEIAKEAVEREETLE